MSTAVQPFIYAYSIVSVAASGRGIPRPWPTHSVPLEFQISSIPWEGSTLQTEINETMILRIDYEESEHADTFGFVSVRVVGGVHVGLLKKKRWTSS